VAKVTTAAAAPVFVRGRIMSVDYIATSQVDANREEENIKFNSKGEHREYFQQFFIDLFYHAEKKEIALNIEKFFLEILSNKTTFTKSDLDMITDIYKRLNKNLK
jgi:hypothetical protein